MQNYKFDGSRRFSIKKFDCADTGEFHERHEAIREFTENLEKINEYQQKLFAEEKEGIIFVFQAMDAAGKDGAVRAVLSCLSPQGVSEHSFKVPSAEENRHDYLWRFWKAIPEKGSISILNRSYYEDVLVQKVHKIYEKNNFADRIDKDRIIDQRYEQIRSFEKYLWENSIRVVKIFLNVSKDEQAQRFISRIDTPKKNWKFSSGDIDEREYWDDYMAAYETCINRTARKNTPWYVVPADHKWYARLVISRIVLNELEAMNPQWPVLSDEEMAQLMEYRERLAAETEVKKEKQENGKKLKPSDTAIGIALKKDRKVLSEKKFKKLLEKSVFKNFCERFGVSQQTQEELGRVYLEMEEKEAQAEEDDLDAVKGMHRELRRQLENELMGCGKEGRKVLERYKKEGRQIIDLFVEKINLGYAEYEEELKQFMIEYEMEVGLEEASAEDAFTAYESKLLAAFNAHREMAAENKGETEEKLAQLDARYREIGRAFRKQDDAKESGEDEGPCEAEAETEGEDLEESVTEEEAAVEDVGDAEDVEDVEACEAEEEA